MDVKTQHEIYDLVNEITVLDLGKKYEEALVKCQKLEQIVFEELLKLNAKWEAVQGLDKVI
ncbi:MAG: hypothetical protein ACE5J9_00810 [Methanosarcinales archaeon]